MEVRRRLNDNIKMDIIEIGSGDVNKILLAYDNAQWLTALLAVLKAGSSCIRELCLSVC